MILQYKKEMAALENKWQPAYDIRKESMFIGRSPVIKGSPADLTRYNIKIDLDADLGSSGSLEVKFCDKYSLILANSQMPSGVYYHKSPDSAKKCVSKIDYKDTAPRNSSDSPRLKNLTLYLKCDLTEKTVAIHINNKLIEKFYLGTQAKLYDVNLTTNLKMEAIVLHKVEISDYNGKILFSANYRLLSFYKLISQIFIFFGALIFLALAYFEKRFFKKFLYFIIILSCFEGFLRIGEKYNQNFNNHYLNTKWKFATSTNLYGTYNNPKKIEIKDLYHSNLAPKIYRIPKPENTGRIICIGSSPVAGWHLPDPGQYAFPVLLEKKINQKNRLRYEVINSAFVGEAYINDPEPNICLKEVLLKLDPDLILFYMCWSPPWIENSKKYLLENHILYDRAKKAVEENSSWIKNDRLLYAALEFKKPIKEIVYLYNFLCNSYLFMGLETSRKKIFNRLYSISSGPFPDKPISYFDETLRLCRDRKIKILIVLPFHFLDLESESETKEEAMRIIEENPEIYYLDLEKALRANKDFFLAYDASHPTEYGHMIIAEEIFKKLTQMGLIEANKDPAK